jgi:hypothetical protein
MAATGNSVHDLLAMLRALAGETGMPDLSAERFRAAVLAFASETPDNLAALDRLTVASFRDADGIVRRGLALRASGVPLADIAWTLEELDPPAALAARHPDMTRADWEAFTRLTTILYSLLSRAGESE